METEATLKECARQHRVTWELGSWQEVRRPPHAWRGEHREVIPSSSETLPPLGP
jgi:hypothetical protein